ncbi:unnamed protein product [Kluyveromyces dobzhanskii CBS 2104]|uniref:WGS project CCBQ000000000 data, contig 00106 n=1 Tax=Kluyveromyces dobzhanskii CBS 2104 TaxID=1427455 RepID=A0A0A8L7P9_9SACH|nr:unnamed protein product [Kluyveromyces dobzhanskii CBS 2104]
MSEASPEEERARKLEEAKRKVQSNVSETPLGSEEPLTIKEVKPDDSVAEVNANEIKTDKANSDEKSDDDEQEKTDAPIDSVENLSNEGTVEVSDLSAEAHSQVAETAVKKEESEAAENLNEVNELFGGQDDTHKDFLTSIQEQQNKDQVLKLKEEISNLKDQLKQLKFVNIDQESTIEELEEQINMYKTQVAEKSSQLNCVQEELAASKLEVEHLKASQQAQQIPVEFSSFSRHSPSRFESSGSIQHPTTDPAMLAKWKNWNVDMTNWRSIGVGPVVEF